MSLRRAVKYSSVGINGSLNFTPVISRNDKPSNSIIPSLPASDSVTFFIITNNWEPDK